jgi:hypothetical protein
MTQSQGGEIHATVEKIKARPFEKGESVEDFYKGLKRFFVMGTYKTETRKIT